MGRSQWFKSYYPSAVSTGRRRLFLTCKLHRYLCPAVCCTPDPYGLIPLQDHVIRKDFCKPQFGGVQRSREA